MIGAALPGALAERGKHGTILFREGRTIRARVAENLRHGPSDGLDWVPAQKTNRFGIDEGHFAFLVQSENPFPNRVQDELDLSRCLLVKAPSDDTGGGSPEYEKSVDTAQSVWRATR